MYQLVATAAFGLEAVVVRELEQLGYKGRVARPGRIEFTGDSTAICRAKYSRSSSHMVDDDHSTDAAGDTALDVHAMAR